MFDTRLSGWFCGRHLSQGLSNTPRTCFTTPFSPLWLISKLLWEYSLSTKIEYPQRIVGLCEMFQAVLSEILPLNLSAFIKRTFQAVLCRGLPARRNGGRRQGLVWHSLPICIRLRGQLAMSLCPLRDLCHGSRGMASPLANTCPRVLSIHLVPRKMMVFTDVKKKKKSWCWYYPWTKSCTVVSEHIMHMPMASVSHLNQSEILTYSGNSLNFMPYTLSGTLWVLKECIY